MTLIALKCSHCHSELVGKHGIDNGKQRYICKNPDCLHTTFFTEYTYNACKPGVKEAVRKQAVNGNKEYFQSRSHGKIRIEMDEMWSYWHNKRHQIWLWPPYGRSGGVLVWHAGTRQS